MPGCASSTATAPRSGRATCACAASADGVELAALGLRLAMRNRRAADVLVAAERWRAGALAERTAGLALERHVEHDLAELRRIERRLRELDAGDGGDAATTGAATSATHAGGRTAPSAEAVAARRELLRLERQITAATRLAPGDPRALGDRLDLAALRDLLGEATLVELVDVDGELLAVVVTRRSTRLVPLVPTARAVGLMDQLAFEVRRMALLGSSHPRAAAALASFRRMSATVDVLLVAPLRLPDGPLVLVPTGPLHSMAWSALPGVHRRAGVTVAPSAAWWMGGASGPALEGGGDGGAAGADRPVVLADGPDLPDARAELDAVARVHDAPAVLAGEEATVAALLGALDGARLAHVAAHGTFRADNPMFSALRLADGPLYVYDLERLPAPPQTVVLTVCNAGRSGVYGGDELLGTGAALLALGVRALVAPLFPVRDESTVPFAADLHRHLADGATAAEALGRATLAASAADDPGRLAAAVSFQCLGRRPAGGTSRAASG